MLLKNHLWYIAKQKLSACHRHRCCAFLIEKPTYDDVKAGLGWVQFMSLRLVTCKIKLKLNFINWLFQYLRLSFSWEEREEMDYSAALKSLCSRQTGVRSSVSASDKTASSYFWHEEYQCRARQNMQHSGEARGPKKAQQSKTKRFWVFPASTKIAFSTPECFSSSVKYQLSFLNMILQLTTSHWSPQKIITAVVRKLIINW
jgi:hypothetical protein